MEDAPTLDAVAPTIDLTTPANMAVVERVLAAAREKIRQDGGDIELKSVEGSVVRVRLLGACTTCHHASQTLGAVRRELMGALGEPVRVLPN